MRGNMRNKRRERREEKNCGSRARGTVIYTHFGTDTHFGQICEIELFRYSINRINIKEQSSNVLNTMIEKLEQTNRDCGKNDGCDTYFGGVSPVRKNSAHHHTLPSRSNNTQIHS